jgi:peptide/nickel transport system permease protein
VRYIGARLLQGVLILFGVAVITFFLPNLYTSPLTIAVKVLGTNRVHHGAYNLWLAKEGLNKPIVVRFFNWLGGVVHGNFGVAYAESTPTHDVPVTAVVGGNAWRSVYLVFIPTILSVLIAIPIGLTQAVRRNKVYDHVMTTFVYVLYSTPAVLVCILLAYYSAIELGIGTVSVSSDALGISPSAFPWWMLNHLNQFILPFAAIICLSIGGLTRYMRGSALDTLVQDYVRTARAKGASPTRVLFRHVLRPSVIPLVTILGLTLPVIIGGALIIENIFNYPGMGVLTVNSITDNDYTVVMAITLITAILTVGGNLLADVFVAIADPRVRLGASR